MYANEPIDVAEACCGLTLFVIGIHSYHLIREGTSPEAFARRDEVAAPARGGFAPAAPGRPGVTVRANYVALPH